MGNKTSLPEREEFYNNLNMEDITNVDYIYSKRVCKDFDRAESRTNYFQKMGGHLK